MLINILDFNFLICVLFVKFKESDLFSNIPQNHIESGELYSI